MDDEVTNFASAKQRQFRGLARVRLSDLQFDANNTISPQNVSRLSKIFQIEGCQRLDERNYIDVVVADNQISAARPECLQNVPPQAWQSTPILGIGPLECLTGQHRVRAAERYLDANDQWWIARVYANHLSLSPRLRLVEEYLNEKPPSDGEIFYKIRKYHLANDETNELKWWARLTETKRKDLKQLLRDARYANAFDSMLPWPGLWAPIRLGSLHRLLCLKCDEELFAYLGHISETWRGITGSIDTHDIVDVKSVERLQGLAPKHSTFDAGCISDMMSTNKLFGRVNNESDRATILAKLLSVRSMIPSLFTFFEDLKYLEPCAKVLKALLPPRTRKSITRGLMGSYFQQDRTLVEHASKDMRSHSAVASEQACVLACQQLWLFALRNFPLMTNFTTRKEIDKDKPAAVEPSPCAWQDLAELASSLGFKTPLIDDLRSKDTIKLVVAQLFERFTSPQSVGDSEAADRIAAILGSLKWRKEPDARPDYTGNDCLPAHKRCGRPFEDDHIADRACLYLPHMYQEPPRGANITTFYRKCNMFRVFMDIKDSPPEMFVRDVAIDDRSSMAYDARDGPVGNTHTGTDHMLLALKCQLEKQIQERREAQAENERVSALLEEQISTSAHDQDNLRRKLHEVEEKLQKEVEEKLKLYEEAREAGRNVAATETLRAELDQSIEEREELRVKLTKLETDFDRLDVDRLDAHARLKHLETELITQVGAQDDARSELQTQHLAEVLGLKKKIQALDDEKTRVSVAEGSIINRMRSDAEEKIQQIRSLELELTEKTAALASRDAQHARVHSDCEDLREQLVTFQDEHRLVRQANDRLVREGQQLDKAMQELAAQAHKQEETVAELELHLREARDGTTELKLQLSIAQNKISELEKELSEARECIERHAQTAEREQDTRYDAEVAVMNQKLENSMTREATRRIQEELNQANSRGKVIEDKMKALETRIQSQGLTSTAELTLVTWERVGDASFVKVYFTCQRRYALQCVRSLELCSQENSSKWDYIGFDRRRIPSSIKQDERYLVDVWIQGGVMGRWLAEHRSFFETQAANRPDMPIGADRPKLTLKRKSPAALPEVAEARVVKRMPHMASRIEEIE